MTSEADDTQRTKHSAALLIIGDELLSGKIRDENVQPLARLLRRKGIAFGRVVFIGDEEEAIANELRLLRQSHSPVFTSGGIGPTHDDCTIAGVALALDAPLQPSTDAHARVAARLGRPLSQEEKNELSYPKGTVFEELEGSDVWPVLRCEDVWVLPGVPRYFEGKLAILEAKLPSRKRRFDGALVVPTHEFALKKTIDRMVATFPNVTIGSYPVRDKEETETEIVVDAATKDEVTAAIEWLAEVTSSGT